MPLASSWRHPTRSWLNVNRALVACLVTFKLVEWADLPALSYTLTLVFSCWFGFVLYRWLDRFYLARRVVAYKKAVLITGCDTGFGNMLARRLASRGFQVFAGCLDATSKGAQELAAEPNVFVVSLDVTDDKNFQEALATTTEQIAKSGNDLWCVVCNAGVANFAEMEWQSWELIQRTFDVNVMGVLRTIRTFLPLLRASRGRIVITASIASDFAFPGLVTYSMTKAAVASLAEGLKRELRAWDVDVCTVKPTVYRTEIVRLTDAKQKLFEDALRDLPEDIRVDYGQAYFNAFLKTAAKAVSKFVNNSPEQVVDALEHAVTTVWPETHLRVASWRQMLFFNLLDTLPIEAQDAWMEMAFKVPVEPNARVR